jgi:hypothetical protein
MYEFALFVERHHNLAKEFFLTTLPKDGGELSWVRCLQVFALPSILINS